MSKQRSLLIVAALLLACALPARSHVSLQNGVFYFKHKGDPGFTGFQRVDWQRDLAAGLSLELSSDLRATDRPRPSENQKAWHITDLTAAYDRGPLELRAEYQNIRFTSPTLLQMYPALDPNEYQKRRMQHLGTFSAAYETRRLELGAHAQYKYLRNTPYLAQLNDVWEIEMVEQDNAGYSDVYFGTDLGGKLLPNLTLGLGADYKDALQADSGLYRLTNLKAGLAADYQIPAGVQMNASFELTNRDGPSVPDQKRNLLHTRLRLQKRLSPALSGFIVYENRSCADSKLGSYRLISNYLRGQLRFTFPWDPSASSYLVAGAKCSPENKADAIFAEADHKLVGRLIAGAAANLQPDHLSLYTAKLSYYFLPASEIHLQYYFRDGNSDTVGGKGNRSYLGLGSSLYW